MNRYTPLLLLLAACCSSAVVAQDAALPTDSMRRLAEKGNAGAQFNLGLMYDNGEGVPKNKAEAAKWRRLVRVRL